MVSLNSVVVLGVCLGIAFFEGSLSQAYFPTTSTDSINKAYANIWNLPSPSGTLTLSIPTKDQWEAKYREEGQGIFDATTHFMQKVNNMDLNTVRKERSIIILATFGGNGGGAIAAAKCFQATGFKNVHLFYLPAADSESLTSHTAACNSLVSLVDGVEIFSMTTHVLFESNDIVIDALTDPGYLYNDTTVPLYALNELQRIHDAFNMDKDPENDFYILSVNIPSGMNYEGTFVDIKGFAPHALLHLGFPNSYLEKPNVWNALKTKTLKTEHYLVFFQAGTFFNLLANDRKNVTSPVKKIKYCTEWLLVALKASFVFIKEID